MEKQIYVEIVTPQKPIFNGNAVSVSVPGGLSPFQVLYGHAPIVSTIEPGIVKINSSGLEQIFAVGNGFVTVQENKVSIFVEKALTKDEINRQDVEKRLSELKNKLKEGISDKEKNEIVQQISELKAQLLALGS
ncbi:MAG: ATP synthase F1 subunit epsilon [Ignavibacteria bacterium]|nr:ATP synthase F1 subunit epsilon [Ignavibacteria bacterium]